MCIRDRGIAVLLFAFRPDMAQLPPIMADIIMLIFKDGVCPVSYTHLDVYKRQVLRVEFVPDTSSGGGEDSQGQAGAGGSGADAARTGDTSRALGYMAALAGTGLILAYLSKKNKKEQQSHLDKHM